MNDQMTDPAQRLCEAVSRRAREAGVFASVRSANEGVRCEAKQTESEAFYGIMVPERGESAAGGGNGEWGVWVGLYTPDRWVSESIEAELMNLGDKVEELLEEELVDQGYEGKEAEAGGGELPVEHFRDDRKLYVFRSPVSPPAGELLDSSGMVERVTQMLLAYEACFRSLGDMSPSDELV